MAFGIMEWARKGKAHKQGFKAEQEEAFKKANIPEFYIKSCKTLQYLFPKAHAVAYVLSAYALPTVRSIIRNGILFGLFYDPGPEV